MVGILRGLFKREPQTCDACGAKVERRHRLDGTWRGKFKMERKQDLCGACLQGELEAGFSRTRSRCILAQPVLKSNAYYAYMNTDDDLSVALGGDVDADEIDAERQAIAWLTDQIGDVCDRCATGTPSFVWLPGETFDYKWWSFDLSEVVKSNPEFVTLCSSCAARAVIEAIDTIGLRMDEIWAPCDGTVLMFSGEA